MDPKLIEQLSNSTGNEPWSTETSELRALPLVVATVQRRHPAAPIALVERSVYDAVQAFRDARVRQYLLILIERWASDAVRDAVTRADEAPCEIRGSPAPAPDTDIGPSVSPDVPDRTDSTRAGVRCGADLLVRGR